MLLYFTNISASLFMSGIRTTTCSVIQRCPSQPVCPAATQTTLYVEWSLTFTCSQWPTTSSVPSHHRWELVTGEVMSLLHLYRLITGEYSSHVRSWLYLVCTFSSQVSTRHRWGHVSPFSLPSHHRWVLWQTITTWRLQLNASHDDDDDDDDAER